MKRILRIIFKIVVYFALSIIGFGGIAIHIWTLILMWEIFDMSIVFFIICIPDPIICKIIVFYELYKVYGINNSYSIMLLSYIGFFVLAFILFTISSQIQGE